MHKQSKFLTIIFSTIVGIGYFLLPLSAKAVCPVCTIAVAAGVGLSRYLGIDDTISGIWIGGLTVSMIFWTISWLDKKKIKFKGRKILTTFVYYLFIYLGLKIPNIIGHPLNRYLGIDKLILGIIIGSVGFLIGAKVYYHLKEKNGGHAYFPFQKVVMPISPLIILSVIFYFLTK